MSIAYAVASLAGLAFFIVSTWMGIRLLLMWRRTRGWPELLMGLGLLELGSLGFGLGMVAEIVELSSGDTLTAARLRLVSVAIMSLGSLGFAAFTWIVFRPSARWAGALTGIAGIAFAVCFVVSMRHHLAVGPDRYDPAMLGRSWTMSLIWTWMAVECLTYWSKLRRRQALGLADPMVVNRFVLWAFVSITALVNNSISTTIAARTGGNAMNMEAAVLTTGILGLAGAAAICLAFMPPAAYERWVRGASRESGPSPSGSSPSA